MEPFVIGFVIGFVIVLVIGYVKALIGFTDFFLDALILLKIFLVL